MPDEFNEHKELKSLLEQNLKYSKEILKSSETIKRFIMVRQVWAFVKFAIIIGLITFGFITLKPFLNKATSTYNDLVNAGVSLKNGAEGIDDLVNQIKQ